MQPGLTPKRAPASMAWRNWRSSSTVPAPTIASGTSRAMAASASSATPVRKVISSTGSPPFTSARASGTASASRSMVSTGMTGAGGDGGDIHYRSLMLWGRATPGPLSLMSGPGGPRSDDHD